MFPGGKANRQLDWANAKNQGLPKAKAKANSQQPTAKDTTRSEHGMDKGKAMSTRARRWGQGARRG